MRVLASKAQLNKALAVYIRQHNVNGHTLFDSTINWFVAFGGQNCFFTAMLMVVKQSKYAILRLTYSVNKCLTMVRKMALASEGI